MFTLRQSAVLVALLCSGVSSNVLAEPEDEIVVIESQQEIAEAARLPLICAAVAVAQTLGSMVDAALNGLLPGQVAYGSTFMSKLAYHYRWTHNLLRSGKNIAVFEYLARNGTKGYL